MRAIVLFAVVIGISCTSDPGYQGRSSSEWIGQLKSGEPYSRAEAARALGHVLAIRPDFDVVVDALIRALADSTDVVQLAAAGALANEGVKSPEAVPGIVAVLGDTAHPHVRSLAATVLGQFGRAAALAVPHLIEALTDPAPEVRAAAAGAIGSVAEPTPDVLAALQARGHDAVPSVRVNVLDALMRLGASYPSVVEFLGVSLADSVATVRATAAFALAETGPRAGPARAALARVAAGDVSEYVRARAADAIAAIDGLPRPSSTPPEPTLLERCRLPGSRRDRRC